MVTLVNDTFFYVRAPSGLYPQQFTTIIGLDTPEGFLIRFLGNRNATVGYSNKYFGTNSHTLHGHDSNVTRKRKPQ